MSRFSVWPPLISEAGHLITAGGDENPRASHGLHWPGGGSSLAGGEESPGPLLGILNATQKRAWGISFQSY